MEYMHGSQAEGIAVVIQARMGSYNEFKHLIIINMKNFYMTIYALFIKSKFPTLILMISY